MKIQFMASLACLQSAITIGNDGATRVRLDIPESEIAEAVKLVLLKGKAFRVTLEPVSEEVKGKKGWARDSRKSKKPSFQKLQMVTYEWSLEWHMR